MSREIDTDVWVGISAKDISEIEIESKLPGEIDDYLSDDLKYFNQFDEFVGVGISVFSYNQDDRAKLFPDLTALQHAILHKTEILQKFFNEKQINLPVKIYLSSDYI